MCIYSPWTPVLKHTRCVWIPRQVWPVCTLCSRKQLVCSVKSEAVTQWNCCLQGEIRVICVLSWKLCVTSSSCTGNLESTVHTALALTSLCPPSVTTGTENTWSVFINCVCTCYCAISLYVSPPSCRDMGWGGWRFCSTPQIYPKDFIPRYWREDYVTAVILLPAEDDWLRPGLPQVLSG
jgi:hypothetical protein